MPDRQPILTINVGSSTIRAVVVGDNGEILSGESWPRESHGAPTANAHLAEFIQRILSLASAFSPAAIAHRIVHGGTRYRAPVVIDQSVLTELDALSTLAPLHNPPALAMVRATQDAIPSVPHIAIFDTAFFADLPLVSSTYAIPHALAETHGIRRYGFHGIAHAAMLRRLNEVQSDPKPRRVITLQLGSGCSAAAILDGNPIDTTMGFTPLEGLMMATRCGDLDPGIITHLALTGMSSADITRMLTKHSGLLGVSGVSGDMRELLKSDDPRAQLAIDVFCHRIRKTIGGYIAILGGLDAIVFSGGIGEHSPEIRARCLDSLAHLGLLCDHSANATATGHEARISPPGHCPTIWVIPGNEASEMARQARALLTQP